MRAIGIDPGIERTGFAIIEHKNGKFTVLDSGCIMTDKRLPFSNRLSSLSHDLKSILLQWKPSGAGVEQIFFSKNVKTAMKVSHARGVILETLEEHGIAIAEFNPSHIKLALTGDAKADKLQMRKMLQFTLGAAPASDDAADAIACAICLLTTKIH